jgi:hypothetical protein
MSATPDRDPFGLPEITRRDRARFVKEARQLRAEQLDRLFRSAGRWLARQPGRPLRRPVAPTPEPRGMPPFDGAAAAGHPVAPR